MADAAALTRSDADRHEPIDRLGIRALRRVSLHEPLTNLPPLRPEAPWHGYSLGDWTGEWARQAAAATRGEWIGRSEYYRQRRRRGICPNTPARAAEDRD